MSISGVGESGSSGWHTDNLGVTISNLRSSPRRVTRTHLSRFTVRVRGYARTAALRMYAALQADYSCALHCSALICSTPTRNLILSTFLDRLLNRVTPDPPFLLLRKSIAVDDCAVRNAVHKTAAATLLDERVLFRSVTMEAAARADDTTLSLLVNLRRRRCCRCLFCEFPSGLAAAAVEQTCTHEMMQLFSKPRASASSGTLTDRD